jgi:hypothetical protein
MTEPNMPAFPDLLECEELVQDSDEWFYRQVKPTQVNEGIVDVAAFQTSDRDRRMLSGVRSSRQSAQGAYEEARRDYPDKPTDGSWGVTVAQVEKARSRVVDDSNCPVPQGLTRWPTGHAYIDQRLEDKLARKRLRDLLAGYATRNRRQYPPPE